MIEVGQTIGNYKITAKLGEGGMGVVYLAEHPVIGKKVAMKAIHPELSRNAEVVSRFMTEAKSVNQIGNEHIVDISDFGNTADGEFYFIMEFLQGESMADRLKRERILPPTRALAIAAQVADALGASHEHGIVHRDLKPENIYLIGRGATKDFVKVLDFGLAKLTQGDEKVSHKTRTGSVMGTPYYMAPEQCEGKPNIDHRADIYSLGVILFEMLTGKVPFGGEGYGEIIVKHITMQPPSPRSINPALPVSMEAIIYRSLAKQRDQRFQSMADFREALLDPEGYSSGAPAVALSDGGMDGGQGAMPVSRADVGSGQVGFGSGLQGSGAAASAPMPSTFRSGIGEIVDDVPPPRSKKGVYALIGAAAVAGVAGAFAVFGGGSEKKLDKPPVAAAVASAPASPSTPAAKVPATVKINFNSDPKGAKIIRADTGKELGETPRSLEIAYSENAVDFVFKKAGYEDKHISHIPNMPGMIPVTLHKVPAPAPSPPAESPAIGRTTSSSSKKAASGSRSKKASSKPTHLDDDAVLEPSFK